MAYGGMGRSRPTSKTKSRGSAQRIGLGDALRRMTGWAARFALGLAAALLALIVVYDFVNPPTTYTMWSEGRRLGGIDQEWTDAEDIAPVMLRAAVAAEDANFCNHWGFDMAAIRQAIDKGANRGASTISQQVVKNVFLWQGRSWPRKALEAMLTPPVEAIWTKRRILEIYLNVAEFGEGVFGVNAAAFHYFRTTPDKLSAHQAALLAAVLPDPKERSAAKPSRFVSRRANAIVDGAETIRRDGRARCFSD
ncbi:monofunctional biosynthetic peptidoglycan transglycosylase [Rhodobacter maris]|uniref:Biosynthetic peptidoglycan transglycosylase n=2 Tax=Rhodobacter maris TaxID=446682 RepID=A0A285T9Z4_9RHOB|nr:monofunctional biosynthetic peptidoglycan transglycosylase [Rhodobacter maris]